MTRNITTLILGFMAVGFALTVQFTGYLNLDNAWLLHAAERVVSGQQLGRDVIESNPPLIIYIMELPVVIGNALKLNPIYVFPVFIGAIALFSLALAFSKIEDNWIKLFLTLGVFILPSWSFGEREHLFIILTLPYFVSMWRVQKPGLAFSLISGLMAGIGLALKPYFLVILAVMVLIKIVLDRRLSVVLSLENFIIGTVVAGYVAYLFIVEKVYINEIFPLLMKYYAGFDGVAGDVYSQSTQLMFLFQIGFWIVFIKDRKLITRPIYFTNFASLAAGLMIVMQGKAWMNYFYPPNFFGFISSGMLALVMLDNLKPLWNKVAGFIATFILILFIMMALSLNARIGLRIKEESNEKMISLFDKYATGEPIYVLTFDLGTIFPAILYSKAQYYGRYGHFWALPGMYMDSALKDGEIVYNAPGRRLDDETRLIAQVMADIARHPPALIVVMDSKYYGRRIGNYKFDFVKYFSLEPDFAATWKYYHKIDRIGDYDIYLREDI